ncbi:hypothetical protein Ade02nite_46570 [Paractinoplanes deccanensis]|uniref:Uncharacterized protein n=1 Tax=Paractinoplanes deccanensis TaxID=113561 RepID=A0ABQ3Y7P6_9ACTN|nr:hypothetical protein [Actinoplanes deccanensis]GID76016.1 hypothetical protein Ade02nite_46570 [Actinoplanes deccanensis]
MIAVVRSELYRTLSIRSSWVSIAGTITLGVLFSFLSADFWSLFAGLGAFGIAVVTTSAHYQHRTAMLLFLGRPRRLQVLAAQCVAAVLVALALALISGLTLINPQDIRQFTGTIVAVPLIALYGVANATVVRKPLWLFVGYISWITFVEGLLGKLKDPWPFTSFLDAASGKPDGLLHFTLWTLLAMAGAVWSIRRDLSGD